MRAPTGDSLEAGGPPVSGSFKLAASDHQAAAIELYLAHMVKLDATELFVTVGLPAVFRVNGEDLRATVAHTAEWIDAMIERILSPDQAAEFRRALDYVGPLASGGSQYVIHCFTQQSTSGFVVRRIRPMVPTLDELGVPEVVKSLVTGRRGIVFVVGGRGVGKSTTLAAMIDHVNSVQSGHIVVIDESVDFKHEHKLGIVTQRQVGVDTSLYAKSLSHILTQAPDVVAIGDVRDRATMDAAFAIAEAGRLCLATLRANDAVEAIERVLDLFEPARHAQVREQLARAMRGIVAHRVVPASPAGRVVAFEVLPGTPRIREALKRGDTAAIREEMEEQGDDGSVTFDRSLFALWSARRITDVDAIAAADNPNKLRSNIERLRADAGPSSRGAAGGPAAAASVTAVNPFRFA